MVVLKYITVDDGEQYAMIIGISAMRWYYVVNLDIKERIKLCEGGLEFLKVLAKYGWMTFTVKKMSGVYPVVAITDGGGITAVIVKTLE